MDLNVVREHSLYTLGGIVNLSGEGCFIGTYFCGGGWGGGEEGQFFLMHSCGQGVQHFSMYFRNPPARKLVQIYICSYETLNYDYSDGNFPKVLPEKQNFVS